MEDVANELCQLGALLINRSVLGVAINAEEAQRTEVVNRMAELASSLPTLGQPVGTSAVPRNKPASQTYISIPSSVHFVVKSFQAPHPWSQEYIHFDVRWTAF